MAELFDVSGNDDGFEQEAISTELRAFKDSFSILGEVFRRASVRVSFKKRTNEGNLATVEQSRSVLPLPFVKREKRDVEIRDARPDRKSVV